MTVILKTIRDLQEYRKELRGTIGFVPTMGALHEGHAALLNSAKHDCQHVILSIFVNPTQFSDSSDLEKYPMTFDADLKVAEREQVDALFFPNFSELYQDSFRYEVREKIVSQQFCGAHRQGHVEGVLTVVLKLFNLVAPTHAYFGEKDYQQLQLIRGMVSAFFLDLRIVSIPIVREQDGLAMSSRNVRLAAHERAKAPLFYQTLKSATSAKDAYRKLTDQGFRVDYVEDWNKRRLSAVHLGNVRLIDNVEIN
jgi:pantoate--beta-alanine ligase